MKHMKTKLLVLMLTLTLGVLSLTGCGKLDNTKVLAEVGDDKITIGVANFYTRMEQAQYETYYSSFMGEDMWNTEMEEGKTYEESIKDSMLEILENLYLMKAHMEEYGVELTEEEQQKIAKTVSTFLENNSLDNKEVISAEEEYVTEVLELLTIQKKMDEAMKSGVDEEVSDEDAAQKSMQFIAFNYVKQKEDGTSEGMTDEEKAQQLSDAQTFVEPLKEAENPDLEAAAKEAGYEVQTMTFDAKSQNLPEDVMKAANAMEQEGQLSDVIETDTGCYVLKLVSLLDREATDAKKEQIVNERKQEQYDSLMEQWREETTIVEHKNAWRQISFANQGVVLKQEEDEEYAVGSDTTADETDEEDTQDE